MLESVNAAGYDNIWLANAGNNSNKLALLGGSPVRTKSFEQPWPIFDGNEEKGCWKNTLSPRHFVNHFGKHDLKNTDNLYSCR